MRRPQSLEIAADVRVSKGAVYHHFPDKRSLFKAVFSEATSRSVATVAESMDHMRNSPPDDVVGMAIDAALTTALKDREYSVLRQQAAAILSLDERKQIKADSIIPLVIQLHAELHDDAATLQVDLEVATSLILAILGVLPVKTLPPATTPKNATPSSAQRLSLWQRRWSPKPT